MTRTSRTDPLNIDSVSLPSTGGQIGMTHCPGKKQANGISGAWARDLELDLERIREWKAELILGLMESREYADLGVSALLSGKLSGIRYLHLPIPDGSVPGPEWEESWPQRNSCPVTKSASLLSPLAAI